jgi:glutathione S-transferase
VLDARLADRPFVCGDRVTLADYCCTAYVELGDTIGFDLAPWPHVAG